MDLHLLTALKQVINNKGPSTIDFHFFIIFRLNMRGGGQGECR